MFLKKILYMSFVIMLFSMMKLLNMDIMQLWLKMNAQMELKGYAKV